MTELYPPGGGPPVKFHEYQVEGRKAIGWTEKPPKRAQTKPQTEEAPENGED